MFTFPFGIVGPVDVGVGKIGVRVSVFRESPPTRYTLQNR